jgi:hypothetical protein
VTKSKEQAYLRVIADLVTEVDDGKKRAAALATALNRSGPNDPYRKILEQAEAFYLYLVRDTSRDRRTYHS